MNNILTLDLPLEIKKSIINKAISVGLAEFVDYGNAVLFKGEERAFSFERKDSNYSSESNQTGYLQISNEQELFCKDVKWKNINENTRAYMLGKPINEITEDKIDQKKIIFDAEQLLRLIDKKE